MQSLTVWAALLLFWAEPAPSDLRVEVITVGLNTAEQRALTRGLSVFTQNTLLQVRAEPQIDLGPLLSTHPRKAVRIWIDGRSEHRPDLKLIIADLQQRRVLLQDLRVGPRLDPLAQETLLQMIESSLEALQNQTLGVPIDEALRRLGHPSQARTLPRAPAPLEPPVSAPPKLSPPGISWVFAGGYRALSWRTTSFAHGPTCFGGLRIPAARGLVAGVSLLYRFQRTVASGLSESRAWNLGLRATIQRSFLIDGFRIIPFFELGADLVHLSASSQTNTPALSRLTADPFMGAGVHLGIQWGAFLFALTPVLEIALRQRQFAETQADQTLVYASARRIWPGGALTIGWQNDL